jgi:hypothetical protein
MIELGSTSSTEDAGLVQLESRLISLDSDGHRVLGQRLHEGLLIISRNILVASDTAFGEAHGTTGCRASTFFTLVGVALLGAESICLRVFKGIVHQASIAALVNLVTINELLFAEGHKISSRDLPGAFQRARG